MVQLLSKKGTISELHNLNEIICHPSSTESLKKINKTKKGLTPKGIRPNLTIKRKPCKRTELIFTCQTESPPNQRRRKSRMGQL